MQGLEISDRRLDGCQKSGSNDSGWHPVDRSGNGVLRNEQNFFLRYKKNEMHLITFCPSNKSSDDANDSMWAVSEDTASWIVADLGKSQNIKSSEVYFVCPTAGHAYILEYSTDGKTWKFCGGQSEVAIQSPHKDNLSIKARYLRVKILHGVNGIWEWRIY